MFSNKQAINIFIFSSTVPNTPRVSVDDLGSYVLGEDSFNKFTEEMVKQFMKEEEMRAQHQVTIDDCLFF